MAEPLAAGLALQLALDPHPAIELGVVLPASENIADVDIQACPGRLPAHPGTAVEKQEDEMVIVSQSETEVGSTAHK